MDNKHKKENGSELKQKYPAIIKKGGAFIVALFVFAIVGKVSQVVLFFLFVMSVGYYDLELGEWGTDLVAGEIFSQWYWDIMRHEKFIKSTKKATKRQSV